MARANPKKKPLWRRFLSWLVYLTFWIVPVFTAAASAGLFTFKSTLAAKDPAVPTLLFWGFVLAGATVVLTIGKLLMERSSKHREAKETARRIQAAEDAAADATTILTASIKAGLEQTIEQIAEMPHMEDARLEDRLDMVASLAVGALRLMLYPRVPAVRANVFKLTPEKDGLNCMASSTKHKPSPFRAGEAETVDAIAFLNSGDAIMFYDDLAVKKPESWGDRGRVYDTFASFPIAAPIPRNDEPRNVYGMLTIDSPKAGSFTQIDKDTAEIVADLLATAFAIVESRLP